MHLKSCFPGICLFWLSLVMPAYAELPTTKTIPPNVALSNITQNSAQVNWETVEGATRYELSYGTDENASNRRSLFISSTGLNLSNLLPNTIYRLKIRAVVSGRAGSWSQIKEFSTQIPVMADFVADDVRDTTVHLIWGNRYSDQPDTYYEIAFGTDPDASANGIRSTDKTFMTLQDLSPDTRYFIKMRVRNPQAVGPWSMPISISTQSYSPDLAPDGLTASMGEGALVSLAWNKIDNASNYDLSYGTDPVAENMGLVPVETNRFSLPLSPNTQYYFKIRSVIKGSSGPWSKITRMLTLPAKPRGLNVAVQSSNEAVISWQSLPGSQIARFYHFSWGTDPAASSQGVTVTTNASYLLTRLAPNHRYAVKVRTVNATGPSPWSEPLSFVTLPAGLKQIQVFDLRHTEAKIKWQPIPGATGYEIAYGTDVEASNQQPMETGKSPVELKRLSANTEYYLKVRPILDNGQRGAWSNIITFSTFPIPNQPGLVSVLETGGTYANFSWPPAEGITTYDLELATEDASAERLQQTVHQTDYRMDRLLKNTPYTVRVRSTNLGGPGAWSTPTVFTTLPDQIPGNVSVSNIAPFEAEVAWEAISGSSPVTYKIRYADKKNPWKIISDFSARAVSLSALEADTEYRVQIQAHNTAGSGPWSPEVLFKTPPAPPAMAPAGLAGHDLTDISLAVEWDSLPQISGYRLSLGTDADASNMGILDLAQPRHALKGLIPNTRYFFKVRAYNQTGEGPWSEILLLTTKPTPPITAPGQVAAAEITQKSITVAWAPAADAQTYEISLGTDAQAEGGAPPRSSAATSYVFSPLTPGTTYYFKVRSINRGGPGPWSQTQSATTLK